MVYSARQSIKLRIKIKTEIELKQKFNEKLA